MSSTIEPSPPRRVTLRTLEQMARRGEPFACLAAYDATLARWLDRAGVHVLLAGDSGAQLALGFERTIDMPLEVAIAFTAALRRGALNAMVIADMPFMSYQACQAEALRNAGRFMTEGLADAVKIEVDASFAPLVARMTRAGIPVCAHIGLRPQNVGLTGGYRAVGRTAEEAMALLADAKALEEAGAVLLLLEAVPDPVAAAIVEQSGVPVIGIGAGPAPHGQILVAHDLLGLSDTPPRFAEPAAQIGPAIRDAAAAWTRQVSARTLPTDAYTMPATELERFQHLRRTNPPRIAWPNQEQA
ncbi:MAG: 3-methyl-2-oxobutanoate hydroxymethyltransferase [Phycisphaerales bacterium]|nr:3-methyl-2-oxobutanoate hydroxymethyltransferase [Phycisphaerales bacterium]